MCDRQVLQLANLTERGVLQLLMDVRFLKDALAGRKPQGQTSDSGADGEQAATAQRMQEFGELEAALQV